MDETVVKKYMDLYVACTRAQLRATGMQARNMKCMISHKLPLYTEEDFLKVLEEEGISEGKLSDTLRN